MNRVWLHIFVSCAFLSPVYVRASSEPALTFDDCRPDINTRSRNNLSLDRELACIKQGFKKIYWGLETVTQAQADIVVELKLQKIPLNSFQKPNRAASKTILLYTHDAQQKALLFQKYLLEKELFLYSIYTQAYCNPAQFDADYIKKLTQVEQHDNSYAIGQFLGYPQEDIIYFYQYWPYVESHKSATEFHALPHAQQVHTVSQWALKNRLWEKDFNRDKTEYEKWLELNAGSSIVQLKSQNEALSLAVERLVFPTNFALKPTITATQTVPWWRQKIGYAAAAIVTAGTAAYSYFINKKKAGN